MKEREKGHHEQKGEGCSETESPQTGFFFLLQEPEYQHRGGQNQDVCQNQAPEAAPQIERTHRKYRKKGPELPSGLSGAQICKQPCSVEQKQGQKRHQNFGSCVESGVQQIGGAAPEQQKEKNQAVSPILLISQAKQQKVEGQHGKAQAVGTVQQGTEVFKKS